MSRAILFAVPVALSALALAACSPTGEAASDATISEVTASPATVGSSISSEATATLPVATSDTTAPAPAPATGQPAAPEESVAQEAPTQAEEVTEAVSPEQRCELGYVTADIAAPELDHLNYCDGQWALLTKMQTDWVAQVYWDGTRWVIPEFDGHTVSGLSRGCYLPETFAETGPPPAELEVFYCAEGDIIYN